MSIEENEKGEIAIVHLTPGGAAWRSNQLHVGDVFLKIKVDKDVVHDLTLMEPEAAAKRIAEGLASGHFEVRFPRRLAWLLGLIAALPYPLYFALTKRMLRPA